MGEVAVAIVEQFLLLTDASLEVQIFPHVRVDGDSLGSSAAMAMALRTLHINTKIYMDETVPERLEFIGVEPELFEIFDQNKLEDYKKMQGIALAIDCSEAGRMGRSGSLFANADKCLVIDHHISSGPSHGLRYIEPKAAAAAELVMKLMELIDQTVREDQSRG